ncbi:MAG: sulfite exporter TauE/SafE family protein [Candidatus Dormibacter sp.]
MVETAAGLVSSFLGIGGGVIHVPLLVRGLGFPIHIATATSHFVLVTMAAVATVTQVLGGDFNAPGAVARTLALSAGVIAGAQLGVWLSQRIGGVAIQWLLSAAPAAIRLLCTL